MKNYINLNGKKIELSEETATSITEELNKGEKTGIKIVSRHDSDNVLFVSTKDNVKDAVLEAIADEANLSEANLRGANLRGANLYGANLREANLYEANLREADLSEANLSEANLSGADLYEANLSGANLRGANLSGANLSGADLVNAKFYGKGGTVKLKKNQVTDFLNALGFQVDN